MTAITSPNAPGKECGDCTLCCKLLGIVELAKPKDVWCQHVVARKGCGIYGGRPSVCRGFACHWLVDAGMGPEWKPNKCKMLLVAESDLRLVVYPDPGADRPWRREPYFSKLMAVAQKEIARGAMVLVLERGRTTLILPDRAVDLGVVEGDDRIVLNEIVTNAGRRLEASVVKAADAARLGLVESGWRPAPG